MGQEKSLTDMRPHFPSLLAAVALGQGPTQPQAVSALVPSPAVAVAGQKCWRPPLSQLAPVLGLAQALWRGGHEVSQASWGQDVESM